MLQTTFNLQGYKTEILRLVRSQISFVHCPKTDWYMHVSVGAIGGLKIEGTISVYFSAFMSN